MAEPRSDEYIRGYDAGYGAASYRANRAKIGRPMRWNAEDGEFELQCLDCRSKCRASYWPITLEFWRPSNVQRCRACIAEADKARQRERRKNADVRARGVATSAAWRERHPGYNTETAALWRAQYPERKRASDRARYLARKAARAA